MVPTVCERNGRLYWKVVGDQIMESFKCHAKELGFYYVGKKELIMIRVVL